MHEIRTDRTKNRLYITLGGFSSTDQIDQTVREVKEAVTQLKTGFDVITDVSGYKPALPEIAQAIQQMQVFLRQSGMRRVVRVTGPSVITTMQFNRLGKASGYQAEAVASVEEAEELLEK